MKNFFKVYFCLFITFSVFGQAPVVSYTTPNTFVLSETIIPLQPNNSGGPIPNQPIVNTFAGSGTTGSIDANGIAATFNFPTVVTLDHQNNLIVVDRSSHKIRKITADGTVSTIAGSGAMGTADGLGTNATFKYPDAAVVDSQGNIFVTDQSNHKIRKITPDGMVSTFAGSGVGGFLNGTGTNARFNYPAGIAVDSNDNLYVADYSNHRIRKITPNGTVSTYAGLSGAGVIDGDSNVAKFNGPTGVCVDNAGNVFVADYGNNKIRKIETSGRVTTIAGSGAAGSSNGLGTSATFYHPAIVTINGNNELFVTDQGNHVVRMISSTGNVTTFAGNGTIGASDDKASSSSFNSPTGVVAVNNVLYVCDYGNHKIRRIVTYGYSVFPDLPQGLNLNPVTGIISGMPTQTSPMMDYTVTVSNQFGSSSFIVSIGVEGTLANSEFESGLLNVYPNPVKDNLYVSNIENIDSMSLFNTMGQEIKKYERDNMCQSIDFSSFQNGMYVLKMKSASGSKEIKIIKQ